MCRRSELVSPKISDIYTSDEYGNVIMKIRLRKSKTDQELQSKWIFPSQRSADTVSLWIEKVGLADGFLFRGITNAVEITPELKSNQINRIYKRLARDAQLSKEIINHISGHSMHLEAAQDLLKSGASMPMIINRGR